MTPSKISKAAQGTNGRYNEACFYYLFPSFGSKTAIYFFLTLFFVITCSSISSPSLPLSFSFLALFWPNHKCCRSHAFPHLFFFRFVCCRYLSGYTSPSIQPFPSVLTYHAPAPPKTRLPSCDHRATQDSSPIIFTTS